LQIRLPLGLTPAQAIEKLGQNDPSLTSCDLSGNAVLQMKAAELIPQIAGALAQNLHCKELNLSNTNIDDSMCESLGQALKTNTKLAHFNLEGNRVGNDGAIHLAKGLSSNRGIMVLNLMNQKGSRLGDAALTEFLAMFDSNVTLLKIVWRLESRQSFRLTKMLTRNNEIDRRIQSGRDYSDVLPPGAESLSAELIKQRAEVGQLAGTPRVAADTIATMPTLRSSSAGAALRANGQQAMDPALERQLKELEEEQKLAIAKVKADFDQRRLELMKNFKPAAAEPEKENQ